MHGATSKDIIQLLAEGFIFVYQLWLPKAMLMYYTTFLHISLQHYYLTAVLLWLLEIIGVTLVNSSISFLLLMKKLHSKISYRVKSIWIQRDITLIMVLVYVNMLTSFLTNWQPIYPWYYLFWSMLHWTPDTSRYLFIPCKGYYLQLEIESIARWSYLPSWL
jgi:hypothetical protein